MQFTLTHKRLLNLLFISISGGKCDTELFCSMTQNEWKDLLFLSRLQGISAIAFEALDYLPANCRPPKDTLIEWLGVSISIESHYDKHLQLAKELAKLVGWINSATGKEDWYTDSEIDYATDTTIDMPMTTLLKSKDSVKIDRRRPIREENETDENM